jgi:hypothetical protein
MLKVAERREHHGRWLETKEKRVASLNLDKSGCERDSRVRADEDAALVHAQKQRLDQRGAKPGSERYQ